MSFNDKNVHKSFKAKKQGKDGKDDWQFMLIDKYTTNALGKDKFFGNIVLKRSFQMALLSVKNLVYNNLVRQKIFCFIMRF